MVRIVSATTGETIGYTESPRYIRKHEENGCNVEACADNATGIAYKSTAYNILNSGGEVADAVDTVIVLDHDAGDTLGESTNNVSAVSAKLDYLSMMSGIEFPETEEPAKEDTINA